MFLHFSTLLGFLAVASLVCLAVDMTDDAEMWLV